VCSACHGNRGQGLTNEWRAQWPLEDQNCWQSKCHAPNHPRDGFEIPHYVPPVLGPDTLVRFDNALDLHDYIRQCMPWQEPASLSEKEYWDITAYLVRQRGLDAPRGPLDAAGARQIQLHP
jgi:cytochrome c